METNFKGEYIRQLNHILKLKLEIKLMNHKKALINQILMKDNFINMRMARHWKMNNGTSNVIMVD